MSTAIELMEKSCFNINEAERLKKEAKDLRRQALSELLISMGIEEGKTVLTSPAGAKGVLRIVKCDLRGWDIGFYRLKKDGTPSCKKIFGDEVAVRLSDINLTYKGNDMYADKDGNLYSEGAALIKRMEGMIIQYQTGNFVES